VRVKVVEAVGRELLPETQRNLQAIRQVALLARQPEERRTVDVDEVQRDRDAGHPPRLGHQLLGDQVRGDLVEYVQRLERQGRRPAEPARRQDIGGRGVGGDLVPPVTRTLQRADEVDPRGEVPMQGRAPEPGRGRDFGHRCARVSREEWAGGVEDSLSTAERVCAGRTSHFGVPFHVRNTISGLKLNVRVIFRI
jgi:hypothetical protein